MEVYNSAKKFFSFVWSWISKWFWVWFNVWICTILLESSIEHKVKNERVWLLVSSVLFVWCLRDVFKMIDAKLQESKE